jgi:GDP-L-fucose synthase
VELFGKRVIVTGGAGFLGSRIVSKLQQAGSDVIVPRKAACDLTEMAALLPFFKSTSPHIVIHAAAVVGGIGANRKDPGRFFYENAVMGIQVIEAARRCDVQKTVVIGTVCAYPKHTAVPFSEDDLWDGYPEETNAPYALAKKMLLVQCQAYRQQYGMNSIYLLPVNLYGPGDNFHPDSSHVIPAVIRKCADAVRSRDSEIVLWGDGFATRDFLYVDDAADAIVAATERYDDARPVNIGSGIEISVHELALKIASLAGFKGRIVWDNSLPNGQPRRLVSTTRALDSFGFRPQVPLDEGLRRTIAWYNSHLDLASPQEQAVVASTGKD